MLRVFVEKRLEKLLKECTKKSLPVQKENQRSRKNVDIFEIFCSKKYVKNLEKISSI